MSDTIKASQEWKVISNTAGHRNLRLWNLLNQASEIIDDIEATMRVQRDQARQTARAAADATSPEALRLIELVREMHSNALGDGDRIPANFIGSARGLNSGSAPGQNSGNNVFQLRTGGLMS